MSEQPHEDPVAHASTKITSYVSLAAMAAEAVAQVAAARARERAAVDERAAAALRADRRTAYASARLGWAPMLDPRLRDRAGVDEAGAAWARAQPWRPDPEAERAGQLAEERLRQLRPDVMDRYDRLRADGASPVDAMRRVAPSFDAPPARPGQPAPDRAQLADRAHPGTEEHAGDRTPAVIAADGYPAPLDTAGADAARAAAAGRPLAEATVQQRGVEAAAAGRAR